MEKEQGRNDNFDAERDARRGRRIWILMVALIVAQFLYLALR